MTDVILTASKVLNFVLNMGRKRNLRVKKYLHSICLLRLPVRLLKLSMCIGGSKKKHSEC